MKKYLLIFFCSIILICLMQTNPLKVYANEDCYIYIIYSDNGDFLFEKQNVQIGDEYIDSSLNQYIVYELDKQNQTGKAKFIKKISFPKLQKNKTSNIDYNSKIKIGLYMTHNDESYITGDGYDSIYGKGGIHDITNEIKKNLTSENCDVILDETLHIPHDSSAYFRSSLTAEKLIFDNNCDAIFDIHRDGASRSTYVKNIDGEEKCKVRIVVGKANPYFEKTKNFALYMVSVANNLHPWLFLDIYLASGHYNQSLTDYALLFEMGSHLVEKDLVKKIQLHFQKQFKKRLPI